VCQAKVCRQKNYTFFSRDALIWAKVTVKTFTLLTLWGRLSRQAHFFLYQCKRDSNYSVDFDLTYKCCTSLDPVKCIFFLWIHSIKTKCSAFCQIKKNKHDANFALLCCYVTGKMDSAELWRYFPVKCRESALL